MRSISTAVKWSGMHPTDDGFKERVIAYQFSNKAKQETRTCDQLLIEFTIKLPEGFDHIGHVAQFQKNSAGNFF